MTDSRKLKFKTLDNKITEVAVDPNVIIKLIILDFNS